MTVHSSPSHSFSPKLTNFPLHQHHHPNSFTSFSSPNPANPHPFLNANCEGRTPKLLEIGPNQLEFSQSDHSRPALSHSVLRCAILRHHGAVPAHRSRARPEAYSDVTVTPHRRPSPRRGRVDAGWASRRRRGIGRFLSCTEGAWATKMETNVVSRDYQ